MVVWPESTLAIALCVKSFLIELKQIHDFYIYLRVFRYARHSGETRMHQINCIVGKIQDSRYLFKVKSLIHIIFDRIEADYGLLVSYYGYRDVCGM